MHAVVICYVFPNFTMRRYLSIEIERVNDARETNAYGMHTQSVLRVPVEPAR